MQGAVFLAWRGVVGRHLGHLREPGMGETPWHPSSGIMQRLALPALGLQFLPRGSFQLLPLPFLPAPTRFAFVFAFFANLTGFILLLLFLPSVSETSSRDNDF